MRVLHIGKYYPPYKGGIENFMRDLLKAQKAMGLSVLALVHDHIPGRPTKVLHDAGIQVVRASLKTQRLYTPISLAFPRLLRGCIRRFQPDVLHLHLPNPSVFWNLVMSEARSIPWVVQWQSDVVPSSIDRRLRVGYRLYRPLEQTLLRQTKRVIVASEAYLNHSEPLKPWRSKCGVVRLGVDPDRLPLPDETQLQAAESEWKPGKLKVLAVGRLTYYKGFDVLIRAVAQTPGVSVQIVGEGELRKRLGRTIRGMGLEDQVVLRGEVPDDVLQAVFASCDVVCLPSLERTEAFGVVLLEAIRYGRVVVASDIPGSAVRWVVETGECGFLVPPGDENALSSIFQRLMSAPDMLDALRQRGMGWFEAKFHIGPVAQQIRHVYQEVVDEWKD
ncbi:MAG: glycosyltransferase [Deltaproteobacteria bacterium]|nr:glycosyltransferase [Deltaproteobacteria bacterium]